jgi:hypothetical protein
MEPSGVGPLDHTIVVVVVVVVVAVEATIVDRMIVLVVGIVE